MNESDRIIHAADQVLLWPTSLLPLLSETNTIIKSCNPNYSRMPLPMSHDLGSPMSSDATLEAPEANGYHLDIHNAILQDSETKRLITWAAGLKYEDLPAHVIDRTKELFLDWYACALGGRHHPAVLAIDAFAKDMGPSNGPSEILHAPARATSPALAALVNGAASHVVEQDDLHNSSMMHPVRGKVLSKSGSFLLT